jgi:hypothetical protein
MTMAVFDYSAIRARMERRPVKEYSATCRTSLGDHICRIPFPAPTTAIDPVEAGKAQTISFS